LAGVAMARALPELQAGLAGLAAGAAARIGLQAACPPGAVDAYVAYRGGGYAVVGGPGRGAFELAARHEGILLDPVYTGRAMAGLVDLVRRGEFRAGETIVFWHTGGTPALFAYAGELLADQVP